MTTDVFAYIIRMALDRLGYEIVLRQMAPRTEIGVRNQRERSEALAGQLMRVVSVRRTNA